jgi:autotransporter-associated beta strand protein
LGNSTTAASDEVVLQTGTFTLAGTTTLTLNLLNGDPAAGNYTLVTGGTATSGSTTNISFAAPVTSTRQTYTLSTPTGGLTLTVAGSPASLTWTGAANGIWDLVSSSDWNNGGAATQFYNFDSVTFGDGVSNNTLTLSGNLQPTAVTFNNNSTAYTLTGSGAIIGTAQLVKNGSGNLTLNNANSFTGGAQLNNGTVTLGNTSALGNGTVTLNGANLAFPANGTLANTFAVTAPSTITAAGADTVTGPVSGSGNLTLELASGQMFTFQGDESAYTGTLIAAGAGTLRFNNSTDWSLANAALALNGTVVADNRSQTDIVFTLGALWGDSGTTLTASDQSAASGSDCTLVIGGLNQDSTFSGVLADSANQQISLTKVGTGTLTLAGNNTYSGDTEVQAGTLNLTGSIASFANFEVDGGATLNLSNGTIEVGSLNIDANATLTGNGTIVGDVVNDGSLLANAGGQIVVNGSFTNVGTLRLTGGEGLSVSGTFTNDGTLDLSTGNQTLPANFVNNGVVITADDVQVSAFSQGSGTYTLQIQSYAGHNYQLQRTTSLTSSWQNVGSAVAGNGTVLNFTDSSPPTPPVFYRIYVAP